MELEINCKELFRYLAKKLYIAVAAALVLCTAAGLYTTFCVTPMYASSAKMYIRNRQSTGFTSSEITAYSDLTKDYMQFLFSDAVLEPVIEECGLSVTTAGLKRRISVSNPVETRILVVQVSDSDPARAKQIVDSLCLRFQRFISELMREDQVTVYDEGTLPVYPYSPSLKRNLFLAALLGFLIPMLLLAVLYVLRGTIDSEESAEGILELKVIGKIPYSRSADSRRGSAEKRG